MNTLKEKSKRQIVVKRVAIVFFTVMLLLTFFSNTIMNYSLAKVSTQEMVSDKVSAKVRGTGTIESAGLKEIKISESREVIEVMVQAGDEVQAGDVLIKLKEGESTEIKTAEDDLESLKSSYYNHILVSEISSDLVEKAENGGGDYQTSANELQVLRAAIDKAEQSVNDIQTQLENAQNAVAAEVPDEPLFDEIDDGNGDEIIEDPSLSQNELLVEQLTKQLAQANEELERATAEHAKYLNNINVINDLKSQYDAIKEKEQEIEELKKKSVGNEVLAEITGTVVNINVKAGDMAEPEIPVMEIQDDTKGFSLSFSVTKEQAAKVKKGDEAEIANLWYYGNDVKAVLTGIKNDTQSAGKNKILVFTITGDVTAGEEMSLSVGEKSRSYDYVVPNSSIREDKNGKFILVIKEKSSPLGNRYVATRIDIEILASDDSKTAVSGAIEGGEYVITTSNRMVNIGDYVRLSK